MPIRVTTESWLAKVLERYPENAKKYDYSRVTYTKAKEKVEIGCLDPEHGFFMVTPDNHLSHNSGCQKCGYEAAGNKMRSDKDEFLSKVFEKYPQNEDWYDYSHVNYENNEKKVRIGCLRDPEHGFFEQTPIKHLSGKGCRACSYEYRGSLHRFDKDEWLAKVLEKRPENAKKFDYSRVDYKNNLTKVKIGCLKDPSHGFFKQRPASHLMGSGCPNCADYGFSPEKPAYYYVHKLMKDGKFLYYKAGISNDWERRLGDLRRGCPDEYDFEPVEQVYYEKGAEAWEFEQEMKNKTDIRAPVLDMDGGTELFLENPLGTIINLCQT